MRDQMKKTRVDNYCCLFVTHRLNIVCLVYSWFTDSISTLVFGEEGFDFADDQCAPNNVCLV